MCCSSCHAKTKALQVVCSISQGKGGQFLVGEKSKGNGNIKKKEI